MTDSLQTSHHSSHQYVTFALGTDVYGIELSRVRELVGALEVTRVPGTKPFIRGVVGIRGKVVAVIDLRVKLGMQAAPVTGKSITILVRVPAGASSLLVGLLVDEVMEVVAISDASIEPPPNLYSELRVSFVSGIAKLGERLAVLLNIDTLLNTAQQNELGVLAEQISNNDSLSELSGVVSAQATSGAIWGNHDSSIGCG